MTESNHCWSRAYRQCRLHFPAQDCSEWCGTETFPRRQNPLVPSGVMNIRRHQCLSDPSSPLPRPLHVRDPTARGERSHRAVVHRICQLIHSRRVIWDQAPSSRASSCRSPTAHRSPQTLPARNRRGTSAGPATECTSAKSARPYAGRTDGRTDACLCVDTYRQ
jgi:hypothetical protein